MATERNERFASIFAAASTGDAVAGISPRSTRFSSYSTRGEMDDSRSRRLEKTRDRAESVATAARGKADVNKPMADSTKVARYDFYGGLRV